MFLIIIAVTFSLLYLILITVFVFGWWRMPDFVPKADEIENSRVSIVVACRNEEVNLPSLLFALVQQSFQNFELILVNDHSEDNTPSILESAKHDLPNCIVVNATLFGKKDALVEGILNASADLIVTTDADCFPPLQWLESIVRFQHSFPSDLIICPVKLSNHQNLFSQLQSLEFISLVASGAGAAGAGMPVLCNGASLAFTKSAWLQSQDDLHNEELSGDDVFLLLSIKKRGGVIRFLKSESAIVETESAKSFGNFIIQRKRWASKSPSYTDWQLIYTACVVFAMGLLPFILLTSSIIEPNYWQLFTVVIIFKYLIDLVLLYSVQQFFHLKRVWFFALILSAIYPFYVVLVGLSAIIFKQRNWK